MLLNITHSVTQYCLIFPAAMTKWKITEYLPAKIIDAHQILCTASATFFNSIKSRNRTWAIWVRLLVLKSKINNKE